MNTKPMKILIIEDDINDCENFINCIKKRTDIELVGITDSDVEALRIVKVKHPDGIVLDLELNNSIDGNIDSFEFISNLKVINLNYEPIIIVTTHVKSKRTYEILHREGVELILYKEQPNYSCDLVLNRFINFREVEPKKTLQELKNEKEQLEKTISCYITKELELIGIPSKMVGRNYIYDAILQLTKNENENIIEYLKNKYNKSDTTITNGINNAIIHAWRGSPIEDLLKYYTARINPERGVPTPLELIHYYKDKIKTML